MKAISTKFVAAMLTAVLFVSTALTGLAAPPAQISSDIVDIAVADGRFTTLVAAVTAAGLVETLKGAGPFTVFAPTDDAFAKLPPGTLDSLMADKKALTDVLLYHVASGQLMAADVIKHGSIPTVGGPSLTVKVEGDKVMINDATVVIPDIEASNGVIHVIDTVLLPPSPATGCQSDYVVQAGDSLSKIAEKLLGSKQAYPAIVEATNAAAASDARYTRIDNPNVIVPGWTLCVPPAATPAAPAAPSHNIVDVAVSDGRFSTLVAALQAAQLVDELQAAGPFTVFAPTDDAFAALPPGTVEGLLADVPALTNVLLYHVVKGQVLAADVVNLSSADTLLGKPVAIKVQDGKVFINDATVIVPDVMATNGVIHVIDKVLLPPK